MSHKSQFLIILSSFKISQRMLQVIKLLTLDNEILEFFIKENSKFSIIPEIRKLSLSYDITKYLEIQKQYQ